jgi:hypothetical protein
MAIASTTVSIGVDNANLTVWYGLTEVGDNAVGEPVPWTNRADRSVQAVVSPDAGSFGGGAVTIEGSHDGVNYATLTDLQGNALVLNNNRIEMIPELTRYLRPRVTSGTGVKLDVYLLMKEV